MSPFLLCLLLVVGMAGSLTEARPGARTPAQIVAGIAAATMRGRLGWLGAVFVLAPLYAAGTAARTGLWFALVAVSWTACALTTALAMDGRAVRVARAAGGRA